MAQETLVLCCRYFADLVVGHMQQVLADMLLESAQQAAVALKLPPPLFSGNGVQGDAICLKGEDLKGAVVKLTVCAWRSLTSTFSFWLCPRTAQIFGVRSVIPWLDD